MLDLTIRTMQDSDQHQWDSYVDTHDQGSFFHLSGWRIINQTVFGHTAHYLMAEQDQNIVGLLPLVEQKSNLFGHALISTPFCVYGGILANSDDIRKAIEEKALELARDLQVDFIELRDRHTVEIESPWQLNCKHATIGCELAESPDAILTSVKKKQRAVIRKSLKNELTHSEEDDTGTCFDLYAESVRNLGTPVFSPKLFPTLKRVFGERCSTLVVKNSDGKPVSGVLSFYYKNEVLPYYGGGIFEARTIKSNDYMYYQLMCSAREQGCTKFDFGRSKLGSGSYLYKKTWGMEEKPLHYRVALIKAEELPNLSPNNPKYQLFIKIWQKLPVWLSRRIGPLISKYLG